MRNKNREGETLLNNCTSKQIKKVNILINDIQICLLKEKYKFYFRICISVNLFLFECILHLRCNNANLFNFLFTNLLSLCTHVCVKKN